MGAKGEMEKGPGVVSSHGYVVDNSVDEVVPQRPSEAAPAGDKAAPAGEAKPGDDKAAPAGEAKPGDDKAAGEAKPGDDKAAGDKTPQNSELMERMAQQISLLTQQLAQGQQQQAPGEGTDPLEVIEQQIAAIQDKAVKGEITYEESMAQIVGLMDQKTNLVVERGLQNHESQKQMAGLKDRFLSENPDFEQFASSPEAQALIQQNPVLDHVSAYFLNKAEAATSQVAQLQTQVAELQKQIGESIKGAATQQSVVVGGESESVGVPATYRGDGLNAEKGGMAALARARKEL